MRKFSFRVWKESIWIVVLKYKNKIIYVLVMWLVNIGDEEGGDRLRRVYIVLLVCGKAYCIMVKDN